MLSTVQTGEELTSPISIQANMSKFVIWCLNFDFFTAFTPNSQSNPTILARLIPPSTKVTSAPTRSFSNMFRPEWPRTQESSYSFLCRLPTHRHRESSAAHFQLIFHKTHQSTEFHQSALSHTSSLSAWTRNSQKDRILQQNYKKCRKYKKD